MKKSFEILALVLLMVVFLTGCTKTFDHYEDKLYSEKTVFSDKDLNTKATNVVTRQNAIKKTLDVFDKGLNIKIDRTKFTENIKLVKNDRTGSLLWQISWVKGYGDTLYRCVLDSSTGEIVEIQWFNHSNLNSNKVAVSKLSDLEIKNLIEPLLKQLEIDVKDYTIIPISSYEYNTYMDIILYNKKSHKEEYIITIDLVNKIVDRFVKLDKQL
ncbi:hypothetical protein [Clostridium peptidivorans]|uniref:hypothetical protein n=1 Tax=Clostridium peptidivorans TaxID=100174 RepID=UPI000BE3B18C|nr:hypothetical protein [Clostridium peptidivorans]